MIRRDELVRALTIVTSRFYRQKVDVPHIEEIADVILGYMGYSERCNANTMDSDTTALFYHLEDLKVMISEIEYVYQLPNHKANEWRVYTWILNTRYLRECLASDVEVETATVYDELTQADWSRQ